VLWTHFGVPVGLLEHPDSAAASATANIVATGSHLEVIGFCVFFGIIFLTPH
jgi:hypothetical protein